MIKLIWAILASGVCGVLFWYAKKDAGYGIDALKPWVPAWIFALCAVWLWIMTLNQWIPMQHVLYWLGVAGVIGFIGFWYPALQDNDRWLDVWIGCAIVAALSLFAYSSSVYWGLL